MWKFKCQDCFEVFENKSQSEIICPKCNSNNVQLEESTNDTFDIEEILNQQCGVEVVVVLDYLYLIYNSYGL